MKLGIPHRSHVLEFYTEVQVGLKQKVIPPSVVQLFKAFWRIIVKHPVLAMDLRLYEKPFLLAKSDMVTQVVGIVQFKVVSHFVSTFIQVGLKSLILSPFLLSTGHLPTGKGIIVRRSEFANFALSDYNCFFTQALGDIPSIFLKKVLNTDLELKPLS